MEGEEEIFKRSRLVARSPVKKKVKGGDLEKVLKELLKIGIKINDGREEIKKQMADLKDKWEEERMKMRNKMEAIEKRLEYLEGKKRRRREGEMRAPNVEGRREEKSGVGEVARKLRDLEVRLDKKEREARKKNVIVKGLIIREKGVKEVAEDLWKELEVREGIKEVKRVGGLDREGRGMALVKMESLEGKKKVMEAKKKLRGRRERID